MSARRFGSRRPRWHDSAPVDEDDLDLGMSTPTASPQASTAASEELGELAKLDRFNVHAYYERAREMTVVDDTIRGKPLGVIDTLRLYFMHYFAEAAAYVKRTDPNRIEATENGPRYDFRGVRIVPPKTAAPTLHRNVNVNFDYVLTTPVELMWLGEQSDTLAGFYNAVLSKSFASGARFHEWSSGWVGRWRDHPHGFRHTREMAGAVVGIEADGVTPVTAGTFVVSLSSEEAQQVALNENAMNTAFYRIFKVMVTDLLNFLHSLRWERDPAAKQTWILHSVMASAFGDLTSVSAADLFYMAYQQRPDEVIASVWNVARFATRPQLSLLTLLTWLTAHTDDIAARIGYLHNLDLMARDPELVLRDTQNLEHLQDVGYGPGPVLQSSDSVPQALRVSLANEQSANVSAGQSFWPAPLVDLQASRYRTTLAAHQAAHRHEVAEAARRRRDELEANRRALEDMESDDEWD